MAAGRPPPETAPLPPGLARDWEFAASRPGLRAALSRAKSFLIGFRSAPPHRALKPVGPRERWTGYFLYLPDGRLSAAHRFTLERLRELQGGLLVVCAAPRAEDVPEALHSADALYWKGLAGWDFSAYAVMLDAVAASSPGADLLLLNDSVLGPFADFEPALAGSPWDLTGFTASSRIENHIQSYAFFLRGVTPDRARAFGSAIPLRLACRRYRDVINLQETRFARLAARSMRVGALWYAQAPSIGDPSLSAALALVRRGFPFLKRSLLGRYAHFQDEAAIRLFLAEQGHPLEP